MLAFFRVADNRRFWSSLALDAFRFGASALGVPRDRKWRLGDAEVVRDKRFRTGRRKVLPREADKHRLLGLNHHRPCCCFIRSSPTTHTSKQILLLLLSKPILIISYPSSRVRYVIRPLLFCYWLKQVLHEARTDMLSNIAMHHRRCIIYSTYEQIRTSTYIHH